jgi:hypothetical protein
MRDSKYAAIFVAANVLSFLVYRAFRGDLRYWFPIEGKRGFLFSIGARMMLKVAADFTGLMQARHPYELGGLYYTVNLLVTQIVTACVAKTYVDQKWGDIRPTVVYSVTGISFVVLVVSFVVLLLTMEPKYRRTFLGADSAIDYTRNLFNEVGASDVQKARVVTNHSSYWKPLEDDIKVFFKERWSVWKHEKPGWFDSAFIAQIDDTLLPVERTAKQIEFRNNLRRKSLLNSVPTQAPKAQVAPMPQIEDNSSDGKA